MTPPDPPCLCVRVLGFLGLGRLHLRSPLVSRRCSRMPGLAHARAPGACSTQEGAEQRRPAHLLLLGGQTSTEGHCGVLNTSE